MKRAFTLLEMLIVIAIMLLLVVATLPKIKQTLDDSKLRESSRQLNSYIAMAKARAASTGRPCGIWLATEQVVPGTPGVFQSSQLYLAEIPPTYSGDIVGASVVVRDSNNETWGRIHKGGLTMATAMLGPPWRLDFTAASAGSLYTLVADGDSFAIRFDGKDTAWLGFRSGNNFLLNGQTYPPTSTLIYPPTATSEWTDQNGVFHPDPGYSFEIIRNPVRIGQPLNLPRGTVVDMTYSGFGNTGVDFYSANSFVLTMFSPEGRVSNVRYQAWNGSNFVAMNDEAQGTLHFLVGRPEKTIDGTNLLSNESLWVSVGRLTGSVVTTDNAPDLNLPRSTPAEQRVFLTTAREFAITQDVKGGN